MPTIGSRGYRVVGRKRGAIRTVCSRVRNSRDPTAWASRWGSPASWRRAASRSIPEERAGELAAALRAAGLVVGFNIRRFDYRVLAGYTGEDYARLLPTLDLLDEVRRRLGFRLGMGHLAQETLGVGKSADGLQSLEWVRQGRLDLVTDYCRRDVEILRDLYLYGRREGCLYYRHKGADVRLRVPVEW